MRKPLKTTKGYQNRSFYSECWIFKCSSWTIHYRNIQFVDNRKSWHTKKSRICWIEMFFVFYVLSGFDLHTLYFKIVRRRNKLKYVCVTMMTTKTRNYGRWQISQKYFSTTLCTKRLYLRFFYVAVSCAKCIDLTQFVMNDWHWISFYADLKLGLYLRLSKFSLCNCNCESSIVILHPILEIILTRTGISKASFFPWTACSLSSHVSVMFIMAIQS